MLNKVFFIVGPPRSGSTLIYNSICSKEIFNIPLPETHLANGIVNNFYNQLARNGRSEKNFFFESFLKTKKKRTSARSENTLSYGVFVFFV